VYNLKDVTGRVGLWYTVVAMVFYFLPFSSMNSFVKRSSAAIVGAASFIIPAISLATFTAPTAPEFGTGTATATGEVATGVMQFYIDLISQPENIAVLGVFIVVVVGLGLARWLKHKLALGH